MSDIHMTGAFDRRLADISKFIERASAEVWEDEGLLTGRLGAALFLMHYGKYTASTRPIELAEWLMEDVIGNMSFDPDNFSLYRGMAGVGWLIEHAAAMGFMPASADDLFGAQEQLLHEQMMVALSRGHYDYVHGGLGVLHYFTSKPENILTDHWIEEAVDALWDTALSDGNTYKWEDFDLRTMQRAAGSYNLGMAHGIPGIVSMLARINKRKENAKARELLRGSVLYLLELFAEPDIPGSIYPSCVVQGEPLQRDARLAWCYGDLGVALALYQASEVLTDAVVKETARKIIYNAIQRKDPVKERVENNGLCHGACGVGYILLKFARLFGDERIKEAAAYWLNLSLERLVISDSLEPSRSNLLTGLAGTGLVYMSWLSPEITDWDSVLLM